MKLDSTVAGWELDLVSPGCLEVGNEIVLERQRRRAWGAGLAAMGGTMSAASGGALLDLHPFPALAVAAAAVTLPFQSSSWGWISCRANSVFLSQVFGCPRQTLTLVS